MKEAAEKAWRDGSALLSSCSRRKIDAYDYLVYYRHCHHYNHGPSATCWLSLAGIHLPLADFRLLASCSRLLAVACWVPPPAGSLSHAGCRLLAASIFHLLAFTFCFLFLAAPLRVHPHMTLAAESRRPWLIDPQRGLWSLSGARAVGLREA